MVKYEIKPGVSILKDEYKDLPKDVAHDIYRCISTILCSLNTVGDLAKRDAYQTLCKYYLQPNGEEYPKAF